MLSKKIKQREIKKNVININSIRIKFSIFTAIKQKTKILLCSYLKKLIINFYKRISDILNFKQFAFF